MSRRAHAVVSAPLSYEEYEHEWDKVVDTIAQARASQTTSLIPDLAGIDMTIYSVRRETGTSFMWSRRDGIASAAARGELTVAEFAAFLEAMGETIVWAES